MKKIITSFLLLSLCLLYSKAEKYNFSDLKKIVINDYKQFYSSENLQTLFITMAVGGILANTSADEKIQSWYQNDIRCQQTDNYNKIFKEFGNGKISIPLFFVSAAVCENFRNTKANILGEWSRRNLRSFLTGTPLLLTLQVITGGSRPYESASCWNPLNDNNGVSGHSFMGAVPFINAAEMTTKKPLKILFYSGSFLTGYSRINDNKHYFSQVVIGWILAYLSCENLFAKNDFQFQTEFLKNHPTIKIVYKF